MPRVPQVTRTVTMTPVEILVLDKQTETAVLINLLLPRTYENERQVENYIKRNKLLDKTQVLSYVKTIGKPISKRYGMTEEAFIKVAKELEPLRKVKNG